MVWLEIDRSTDLLLEGKKSAQVMDAKRLLLRNVKDQGRKWEHLENAASSPAQDFPLSPTVFLTENWEL